MTDKQELNHKKVQKLTGIVVSVPGTKTVVVEVDTFRKHPKYHKRFRTKKKYVVHAEQVECKVGDKIDIEPTRAYSRRKRFSVSKG